MERTGKGETFIDGEKNQIKRESKGGNLETEKSSKRRGKVETFRDVEKNRKRQQSGKQ